MLLQALAGAIYSGLPRGWIRLVGAAEAVVFAGEPANRLISIAVVAVVVACDFSGGNTIGVDERAIQT